MKGKQVSGHRVKFTLGFLLLCMYLLGGLFIPGLACASEESELFLARGNKLYLDGNYSKTQGQFSSGHESGSQQPRHLGPTFGTTSLQLKDYPAAKEAFTKALALDPNYPQAKLYTWACPITTGELPGSQPPAGGGEGPGPGGRLGARLSGPGGGQAWGASRDALTNLESRHECVAPVRLRLQRVPGGRQGLALRPGRFPSPSPPVLNMMITLRCCRTRPQIATPGMNVNSRTI